MAQKSNRYWQVAVADLHKFRFISPTGDQPASEYYRSLFRNLREKVEKAKTASEESVDEELITMAKRHIAVDERILGVVSEFKALAEKRGLPADQTPIGEQFENAQQLVLHSTIDPSLIDGIDDEKTRGFFKQIIELENLRLQQLHEIEIMQAKLTERYPAPLGSDYFTLPNIDE